MRRPDPLDELARFRVEVDETARARDLAAVTAELHRRPTAAPPARRWTLGVVVAVILAGPAAAVASDGAAPGDLLYPIKLATEPVVQLFDRDVVVEHRVEEVAELIDRQSEDELIEERIAVARDALAETDAPAYEEQLEQIVDRWVTDRAAHEPAVTDLAPTTTPRPRPEPERPSDREPEPASVDPPTTTTTTDEVRDAPPPRDATTTTSTGQTQPPPEDRPPPDDRPRDQP